MSALSQPQRKRVEIAVGDVLDERYQIQSVLDDSTGGMGSVFVAFDKRLQRQVALKTIKSALFRDYDHRMILRRFEAEALGAARLEHPNIIEIYDYSATEESFYYVMRYVKDSKTLRICLEEFRKSKRWMPLSLIRACMLQAAAGLRATHENGIVHRDIKLENLLIFDTPEGTHLKILDFGVARLPSSDVTRSGDQLGTPSYYSPEWINRMLGVPSVVDHRSDIFSLGVVLYRLLTGRKPFVGDDQAAVYQAVRNVHPNPPSQYRIDLASVWDDITFKLLEKDVDKRFQKAEEVYEALLNIPTVAPSSFVGDVSEEVTSDGSNSFHDLAVATTAEGNLPSIPSQVESLSFDSSLNDENAKIYKNALKHDPKAPPTNIHKLRQLPKNTKIALGIFLIVFVFLGGIIIARLNEPRTTLADRSSDPLVAKDIQVPKGKEITPKDLLRDFEEARSQNLLNRSGIGGDRGTSRAEAAAGPYQEPTEVQQNANGSKVPSRGEPTVRRGPEKSHALRAKNSTSRPAPLDPTNESTLINQTNSVRKQKNTDGIINYRHHSSEPEVGASGAMAKSSIGIPTGTMIPVKLLTPLRLSTETRSSTVTAVLAKPFGFEPDKPLLPGGTTLIGSASVRFGQHDNRIEITFAKIVYPDHTEGSISASASMPDGSTGIAIQVVEADHRSAANMGETAIDLVDRALSGSPLTSATRRFAADGRSDARALRQTFRSASLSKDTAFVIQLLRPL